MRVFCCRTMQPVFAAGIPMNKAQFQRRLRGFVALISLLGIFLAASPASGQDAAPNDASTAASKLRDDQPVRTPHAMVVSVHHLATDAGVEILRQGGNAVDAAVAVGFALAVV